MSYGGNGRGNNGHGSAVEDSPMQGVLLERPSFGMTQAAAEVDTQVTTAKRYPRSIKQFKENALSLATLDIETASSCFYTLPARKGGDGKPIEGPSVRMAEIVVSAWGNIRVQASIVGDDGQFVTVQGRCWDVEKNSAMAVEVSRRVVDKYGKRYSADMISTTTNAACSIAIRNAVFLVVPRAIWNSVYNQARRVAIGDATTLVKRRADMLAYFAKMGVTADRVCAAVEKPSIEDITVDDLASLLGISTAIRDGDTSIDEAFPPLTKDAKKDEPPKSKSDQLADSLGGDAAAQKPPEASTLKADVGSLQVRINVATDFEALKTIERDAEQITDDAARLGIYQSVKERREIIAKLPKNQGGKGELPLA